MSRAAAFKRAYRLQWHISNQKEKFIELFFRSLGFTIRPIGIGTGSEKYYSESGSKPDYALCYLGDVIAYIEVTGANKNYRRGQDIYITLDKFQKYYSLAKNIPVLFIFIGLNNGKMEYAGYCWYEDLYPYSEKNIIERNFYGIPEKYIVTPFKLWKPLHKITLELSKLL
ncbi:MAG: hypothetical protein J7K23_00900 [Thermoproteales archaeon]|nr:hypothetical protein [Thermoproteales archaeon]